MLFVLYSILIFMKPEISIGYLPILDHLTLGVAEHNEGKTLEHFISKPVPFNNWPSIAQALGENKLDGAFLLFPLALKLYRENPDISLILLGHREGQVLVVDKDITNVHDLKGKTIQIPDLYSTHHILLSEILTQAGMDVTKDVKLKIGYENIKDISTRVSEEEISGLIIAEPIGTEVRKKKGGKIITLSKDFHPHHIDCVLVVKNNIILEQPEGIQELVESLVKAGAFINAYPRQAAEIGEQFLNWPKKLLLEALTHDEGHILFWDLLPRIEDFEELQHIAVNKLKLWKEEIDLTTFINANFAKKAYRSWIIDTRRETKDKGQERTVPGNMTDAVSRIVTLLGAQIFVTGIKYIHTGEKYPTGIERGKEININAQFFGELMEGKEIVLEAPLPQFKAIAFQKSSDTLQPDKVVMKLTIPQAERCLKALAFGGTVYSREKNNETSYEELLYSEIPISIIKKEESIFCSLHYSVFLLLGYCLNSFK
jgi:NitT/TauT family transport system substrate-binding protein